MSEIRKAIVKALAELENPTLDGTNPHFKSRYVTLAGLENHVRPVLSRYGLAILQPLTHVNGAPAVLTVLLHESGEEITFGPVVLPMVKADPQAAGSAITYARRYALAAVLGICGEEDDDANGAMPHPEAPRTRQATTASTPGPQAPSPAQARQSAPPASGERITKVDEKPYQKKDGSTGTRYAVFIKDGPIASTFSATIASHAKRHAQERSACSPILRENGKYVDLEGFACCEQADEDEGWGE